MSDAELSEAIDFLKQTFDELLIVAESCVREKVTTPALVLVYSGIDVAGWLYVGDPTAPPRTRFTKWVTRYLLPAGNLGVSALELFGARCGLLHNFGSESDLSRQGKVRQIQYARGSSSPETVIEMATNVKMEKQHTALKVEELIAAFRTGLARFFEGAAADPKMARTLIERSAKVLGPMSEADAQGLLLLSKPFSGE